VSAEHVEQVNLRVVRRFYEELWNQWKLDLADEILAGAIRFRGSLGTACEGRQEFRHYAETVRSAFPDWHNQVEEILASEDRVVARMTWTGTQLGKLGEIEPTGARVDYCGAAFFRLSHGVVEEAWAVGDTQELWRALGRL